MNPMLFQRVINKIYSGNDHLYFAGGIVFGHSSQRCRNGI